MESTHTHELYVRITVKYDDYAHHAFQEEDIGCHIESAVESELEPLSISWMQDNEDYDHEFRYEFDFVRDVDFERSKNIDNYVALQHEIFNLKLKLETAKRTIHRLEMAAVKAS